MLTPALRMPARAQKDHPDDSANRHALNPRRVLLVSGFFLKDGCCDGSLSIAESTIARTHLAVTEDFESFLFESAAEQLR